MNIQFFSLILSLLGLSLCSEPTDHSSIDESDVSSQYKRIEISQSLLKKKLPRHSSGLLGPCFEESNILSRKKSIQTFSEIPSHSLDRLPLLFTFSSGDFNKPEPNRDGLTRPYQDTYQEMKTIYPEPYFEICRDDSLNQRFIELTDSFSRRINDLLNKLEKRIPVLKSLLETFGVDDDFWIFFWVTHCKSDFESGFPAYQTLLFKDREFSGSFKIKTGLVLYQITLKIQSYIEKLNALSLESDHARISFIKFGLMDHLGKFEEYQNRFPIKRI
jgi:hypothetical protein